MVILYECFTILISINFKEIIKYAHSPLNILTGWSFIFQSQQDLLARNLKVATEWVCSISTVSEPLVFFCASVIMCVYFQFDSLSRDSVGFPVFPFHLKTHFNE